MKISVFKGTSETPASYMKNAYQTVEIDFHSIQKCIVDQPWSPSIFKGNNVNGQILYHRIITNFESTEIFGVDIDGGCTIEQAIEIIKKHNLKAIVATTRNHQKDKKTKKGEIIPACDRFRIILFLERPIFSDAQYKIVFQEIKKIFPTCDDTCKDAARFYYPCKEIIFTNEGNNFANQQLPEMPTDLEVKSEDVVETKKPSSKDKKGQLSAKTLDFIAHGAPDGLWHNRLISALFDLKAQGYSYEEALIQIKKASLSAHGDLDNEDLLQIKDIYEKRVTNIPYRDKTKNTPDDQISDKVKLNLESVIQMSTVNEKGVDFIWQPYIARGFVTLFTGDPGSGKSTITANIISIISNGLQFWDGKNSKQGNSVIFTAEDPLEEVLKPRLLRAGANTENVFAFTLPLEFDEIGRQTILETIKEYDPELLVIDPLVAYLGAKVDTSKANEVRAKMLFLSELARDFNLAILVIRHCAKGTGKENTPLIYRGHGSIDFVAAVRSEVMLICDPKNEDVRFFGHTKSNLTKLGKTICFNMTEEGPVLARIEEKSLSELFGSVFEETNDTIIDEVTNSIREILSHGPVIRDAFFKELKAAGFTNATIRRGVATLGEVRSKRISFVGNSRGVGTWVICTNDQAQALDKAKFEHLEQLNDWIAKFDVQDAQILNPKESI